MYTLIQSDVNAHQMQIVFKPDNQEPLWVCDVYKDATNKLGLYFNPIFLIGGMSGEVVKNVALLISEES